MRKLFLLHYSIICERDDRASNINFILFKTQQYSGPFTNSRNFQSTFFPQILTTLSRVNSGNFDTSFHDAFNKLMKIFDTLPTENLWWSHHLFTQHISIRSISWYEIIIKIEPIHISIGPCILYNTYIDIFVENADSAEHPFWHGKNRHFSPAYTTIIKSPGDSDFFPGRAPFSRKTPFREGEPFRERPP